MHMWMIAASTREVHEPRFVVRSDLRQIGPLGIDETGRMMR